MLNWLTRYAFVSAELSLDEHGNLLESVLDVGCGPHGLSTAVPNARFAGADLLFPGTVAPGMVALRNEPGPLPFADQAFDTVVCLDVLEHVPPGDRAGFVRELERVAAKRVLVACPSDEGAWIDNLLRETYAARGIPAPIWLNEHDEHGLPTAAEIAAFCAGSQEARSRELTMTNGLLSTLAVIADMLPEFADRAQAEFHRHGAQWLSLFEHGRFGSCYRKGYAIERLAVAPALVSAASLPDGVFAALRCPACGETGFEVSGPPFCRACGHLLSRDPSGAWDVTAPLRAPEQPVAAPTPAPARAELDPVRSDAARKFLLSPDWERPSEWLPVVGRYVASADPDAGTALCLDATNTDLGLAAIHEMLMLTCETISGGRPFGEVVLLDAPFVRDGLIEVRDASELGFAAPPRPTDGEEIAAHAVAAKRLHDAVRAVIERWRFEHAADPWATREPLVSVRIPTWNGAKLLVERAIPSILSGTYANVEVLICSDGPDPVARDAVTSYRDPRVRYLELPERPLYPSQSWSFWEVAGIHAVNATLDAADGAFIAPLDHDDAFTDDHIHGLLMALSSAGADLAYGQALMQEAAGKWSICGTAPLAHGQIAHGSAMYSARLAHMRLDADCWLLQEPGDWNMWRRILQTGCQAAFLPRVVLAHFQERSSIEDRSDKRMERTAADIAADVTHTGLEWLIQIPLPVRELVA